ncbi:MAG: CBS domain-containing protein, partial [Bacteroidota bacterium]
MMNDYVRDYMTKDLVTLGPESTLAEVREIMLSKHIHHIPVVGGDNGSKLIGMVTSWDLVKLGKSATEYAEIRVKEIMTEKIAAL